jgi:hypothetical protein
VKNKIALFIGIFLSLNLKAQIQSNCIVPPVLQVLYEEDVMKLAIRDIYNTNSPDKNSILVPHSYTDRIWKGLASIYNLGIQYEADSVFNKYCIHDESCDNGFCELQTITALIDTNYTWTHNWMNMVTQTGIGSLDNFLATYGFTVLGYFNLLPGLDIVELRTSLFLNLKPVSDSIKHYSGIIDSYPDAYAGDGNYMVYNNWGSSSHFGFDVGWMDCPSGCICHRIWEYSVDTNCIVHFLGKYSYCTGNTPSPSSNCISSLYNNIYNLLYPEICMGQSYFAGGANRTISGIYYDTLQSVGNYDSIIVTHLTVKPSPPAPIVTVVQDTLYSNVLIGNQWYNMNGLIPGANGNYYVPIDTGNYFVKVTSNNCESDSSNIISFFFTSILKTIDNRSFPIFPNPSTKKITVEIPQKSTMELVDIHGKLILKQILQKGNAYIDMSMLAKGIYFIKLYNADKNDVFKILKE